MSVLKRIEYIFDQKGANNFSFITCLTFLGIHAVYLILFAVFKVKIMMYFNVCSVLFYLLMILVIRKGYLKAYIELAFLEVMAHMTLAVICLGFGYGFEFCFLGAAVMMFFASYFSSRLDSNIHPIVFNIFNGCLVLFLYFFSRNNSALYSLDVTWYKDLLFIFHTISMFGLVIIFMWIMTEYALALEKTNHKAAITDNLTGLMNRDGIISKFDNSIIGKANDRYKLIMLDIDDFKNINDSFGHNCGDAVITGISRLARDYFRTGFVSRWGGEEFVIIVKTDNDSFEWIDGFRKLIAQSVFVYNDTNYKATVTVGVQNYYDYPKIEAWVDLADKKLYFGKQNGKNQTVM